MAASDALSGVQSVIDVVSGESLAPAGDVPAILQKMHELETVDSVATTHIRLDSVQEGTPVGVNSLDIRVVDAAGNEAVISGTLNVVSQRTNRNFSLFPEFNS